MKTVMGSANRIPDEIWFSCIFTKLSFKSLLTCKCVCRSWNLAPCDPHVARIHFFNQNKTRDDKLLITSYSAGSEQISVDYEASKGITGNTSKVKLNLNFPSQLLRIDILGSSYGLLCASVTFRKRDYSSLSLYHEKILIWNPSTGDSKLIDLAYHRWLGFSYDPSINDTNIVRIWNFGINQRNQVVRPRVDTYSMKNDLWNDDINVTWVECKPLPLMERVVARAACLVNEQIMYWMVRFSSITRIGPRVLEYNLRKRKVRTLQMPSDFREKSDQQMYMKDVGGCLGIFGYVDEQRDRRINERFVVWTMKESGEWSKFVNIDSSFIAKDLFRPICLMRNGKLFLLFREGWSRRSTSPSRLFVFYDPVTRRKIEYVGTRWSNDECVHQAVAYVESIFSPTSISRGA